MDLSIWNEQARVSVAVIRAKGNAVTNTELEATEQGLYDRHTHNILLVLTNRHYQGWCTLRIPASSERSAMLRYLDIAENETQLITSGATTFTS